MERTSTPFAARPRVTQFPSAFDTCPKTIQSCFGSLESQSAIFSTCVAVPGSTPLALTQRLPRVIWVGVPEPLTGVSAVISLAEPSPGFAAWRVAPATADEGAKRIDGSMLFGEKPVCIESAEGLTLSGEEVGGDAGCDEVGSGAGGKREGGRDDGNKSEHGGARESW